MNTCLAKVASPIVCALALALSSGPVLAGGLSPPEPVPAEPSPAGLGRLFSSPEERARIDEARRLARLPPPVNEPEVEPVEAEVLPEPEPPPPPPRGSLTLDGYVIRGAGAATVWVNGESSSGGPLLDTEASVVPPQRHGQGVHIEAADGSRVLLRPGQTLAEGQTVVEEAWLRGDEVPASLALPMPRASGAAAPVAPLAPAAPTAPMPRRDSSARSSAR